MVLSLSSGIYPDMLKDEHLGVLAEYGIKSLELLLVPGRFDYHDRQYIAAMDELLKHHDMSVSTVHLPFGSNLDISRSDTCDHGIAETAQAIDAAAFFHAGALILHASRFVADIDRAERCECSVNSVRQLLALLPERGMTLALENLPPGYLCSSAEELQFYFDELNDSRVGFCLDTGHANMSGQLDTLLKQCGNKLVNIHVHDNLGNSDSHWIPGQGNINWRNLTLQLETLGYAGPLTYEVLDFQDNTLRIDFLRLLQSGNALIY